MQKIVVPVDFSAASSWGYYYAYEMAKQLGAELVILHLYWSPYVESTYPASQIQAIIDEKEKTVLHHLKQATLPPLGDAPDAVSRSYFIRPGSEYSIVQAAQEYGAELIVMGTHGSGNALDKIWGTNTGKVMKEATCPVIAVPPGATFESVKRIAYATDFKEKDIELLFQLSVIATAIKAEVHCVHVELVEEPFLSPNKAADDFKARFEREFEKLPLTLTTISADGVEDGLATFCRINDIHLIALLSQRRNLLDKIFGGGSTTKAMVQQTQLPLLAFH